VIAAVPLVLLLSAASAPGAPDGDRPATRAEELRRRRLEKAAHPPPPDHPGWLERTLLALEKAERPGILDFNVGGVYPRLQGIASGSQTAAGVRLWRPDIGGTPWDAHGSAFYSRKGYELYDLQVGRLPHRGRKFPLRSTKGDDVYELGDTRRGTSRLVVYGSFRYRHNPEEDFFGLGDETLPEDHSSFRLQDATYELVTGYPLGPSVMLNLRGGLRQLSLGPGEDEDLPSLETLYDDVTAPGLRGQPDFLFVTTSLLVDRRDEPGNPHRGFMAALSHTLYDDRASDAFRFQRLAADLRAFVPLGSRQRVLAVRAMVSRDAAADGRRVPFYLQETLGGSHTLRGFDNFRFRGEKLLLLQGEYRWEAAPALELVLFADAGKTVQAVRGLDLDGLHAGYGFGVRLKTFESVLVRLDVARSREKTRVLLRFSPSY
jgi:hypothetical protein